MADKQWTLDELTEVYNKNARDLDMHVRANHPTAIGVVIEPDDTNALQATVIIGKDSKEDFSDIPATTGPDKIPVKITRVNTI